MVEGSFLQSHALFGGVNDEAINEILPLLEEEVFLAGANIVTEGETGDRLYLICQGSVEVIKIANNPEGKTERRLAVFEVGDTFGEMELIDIQPRSATVRALEDVTAVSLSNEKLFEIYNNNLETFAMIIMNIAREISRRLRAMDTLVSTSLYSASDR